MTRNEKLEKIGLTIEDFYRSRQVSSDLSEVILYSVQAGGKRIRPLLLLELIQAFGLELTEAHYQVAAALEMIHTGSLIHDDLPAMDDDDYRRGRLTSHKKFGEDMERIWLFWRVILSFWTPMDYWQGPSYLVRSRWN